MPLKLWSSIILHFSNTCPSTIHPHLSFCDHKLLPLAKIVIDLLQNLSLHEPFQSSVNLWSLIAFNEIHWKKKLVNMRMKKTIISHFLSATFQIKLHNLPFTCILFYIKSADYPFHVNQITSWANRDTWFICTNSRPFFWG